MAVRSEILHNGLTCRVGTKTGIITELNVGDTVFSMRWGSHLKNCVIQAFKWWWTVQTSFGGSPQMVGHALYKVTDFVASDTGGLTWVNLAGLGGTKITGRGNSLLMTMVWSDTGTLTPGTRTVPVAPIMYDAQWAAAAGVFLPVATQSDFHKTGYIWLKKDEGIIVNNMYDIPSQGGTIIMGFSVAWAEVPLNLMQ